MVYMLGRHACVEDLEALEGQGDLKCEILAGVESDLRRRRVCRDLKYGGLQL